MIRLREVQHKDVDSLFALAQIPGFINLPSDRKKLSEMIQRSLDSFHLKNTEKGPLKFVFVAEDLKTGRVVGTSMVATQHGTPDSPHFYFEIGNEEKFSTTINTGFIHGTLKLKYDTNGPSEVGGLVIDPETRNSNDRVGRQVSFVRFLFIGMNRSLFKNKILAELLPPLNQEGRSPLWEAIGRRFTNMDYWEADRLCQQNKEFIFSLFPTGKIYTTFLPAEARHAIGKVGQATEPVIHMLQKIGFKYMNQVDPFDGGPHLWADTAKIQPIKKMSYGILKFVSSTATPVEKGLLSLKEGFKNGFRSVSVEVFRKEKEINLVTQNPLLVSDALETQLKDGVSEVAFMPYYSG